MGMDERKFRILQAIIDDYILTAMPVGSRTISKKYETGLSSATIRNEMSDLEELGYLDQPHVSAGRIPSAKAYRLYVDQLQKNLHMQQPAEMGSFFDNRARKMEDVINQAAQVLSGLTHYPSLVMSPKGRQVRIRNLQLVQVNSQNALLILVTDGGIMRDSLIHIDPEMDSDALYVISRNLTQRLSGCTLMEATALLSTHPSPMHREMTHFFDAMQQDDRKTRLALGGTSNILNFPEYNDVEKAKGFLSVLETREKLLHLLDQRQEMAITVRIGPETGIPELEGCSVVTATYSLGDSARGTLGVIGPTRMEYGRVLRILQAMGQQLSSLLGAEEE